MKQIAIIGAGPIGLYLAEQLKKAGLHAIAIYDPRAGVYTRPGHVNRDLLFWLAPELGRRISDKAAWHIKDIERLLFERIKQSNITVEQKKFVRFHEGAGNKGIVLQNLEGNEEVVECDFVFDCTGSQRSLIHEINRVVPTPPFTLQSISSDVRIKRHIIAYGAMSEQQLRQLNEKPLLSLELYTTQEYLQGIEKLRRLGWREFGFPFVYGMNFDKGKVCIYSECPDGLTPEDYELWINTVIEAVTSRSDITFSQLPPSKKYASKPRLVTFNVEPMELLQAAYHSANFPTVIPMGDAQIDPNYTLAHGIKDGLSRVQKFIEHIITVNGCIVYFDGDEYREAIKLMMLEHKRSIIVSYAARAIQLDKALLIAESAYRTAADVATSQSEKEHYHEQLKEIAARIAYQKTNKQFNVLVDSTGAISFSKKPLDDLTIELMDLSDLLTTARSELPPSFITEDRTILKEQAALTFYQHSTDLNKYQTQKQTLLSNLIICYCRLTDYKTAIGLGLNALNDASSSNDDLIILYKKNTFNVGNVLKTLMRQKEDAAQYVIFQQIAAQYQPLLGDTMYTERLALCPPHDEARSSDSKNTDTTGPHSFFHMKKYTQRKMLPPISPISPSLPL